MFHKNDTHQNQILNRNSSGSVFYRDTSAQKNNNVISSNSNKVISYAPTILGGGG